MKSFTRVLLVLAASNVPALAIAAPTLQEAIKSSDGEYSPNVRQAYLARAQQDARQANSDDATWDWLAKHPDLRDGLLSLAHPLPPVYLKNLATLRRELGPAITEKYPQLVFAMAIRPDSIDQSAAGATQRDDPDKADAAKETPDPRVEPLVRLIKQSGKTVVDLDSADPALYEKLSLKPPANDGEKRKLLNAVALASGTYPARKPQGEVPFIKQLISEYETKVPTSSTGPQWPMFPLDKAPWPLLLPLRDTVPADEMTYVWNHFRGDPSATPNDVPMPSGKRLMTYGRYTWDYDKPDVRLEASAWNPEALPRIVQDGGVCGRMSSLAEFSFISLGRPAMGMYQPGHRACLAYNYTPKTGYYAERMQGITSADKTTTGWFLPLPNGPRAKGDKNPRVGVEYQLGLAMAMNVGLDRYIDTRIATLIAAQMPASDQTTKVHLLSSAAKLNPYNIELWYALAKANGSTSEAVQQTLVAADQLMEHSGEKIGGKEPELSATTDFSQIKPKDKGNIAAKDAADILTVMRGALVGDGAVSKAE